MSNVNDISDEVLTQSIRDILESADLNVMTSKLVRNQLKTKLDVEDLECRKKQINSIINEVITELSKSKVKSEDKPNKVKVKSQPNVDKTDEKPINNKNKHSKSDIEDSSSDESLDKDDVNDEELARKLHNEELNSKRRPSRTNYKKPKTDDKKSKKKNKDSDDSKPKSKRKGGNGYTRPLPLSPDLAEFLGESEMPRHEVVKRIWSYVKEKNLFDPKNKQFAICDNQLIKVFGRKRVRMFGMMKFLAKHFI